ncbi:MAG: hypothetical protein RBR37_10635 [Advenella sp.]|nr:hypothetical protein [Advenella sp.]NLY33625.1 hypothetical protein [Alcaligenaceae bacterium]
MKDMSRTNCGLGLWKILILCLGFLLPFQAKADRTGLISAQTLIEAIQGNVDNAPAGRTSLQQQAFADGYISALIDSREWCFTGKKLPHEIKSDLFEYLQSQDAEKLLLNAADLSYDAFTRFCSDNKQ